MRHDRTKARPKRSPSKGSSPARLTEVKLSVIPGGADPAEVAARSGKVRNARARAVAGYYDRPEIREQVLEAVLRELSRR